MDDLVPMPLTIYSKTMGVKPCHWCDAAKEVLDQRGLEYVEISLDDTANINPFLAKHAFLKNLTVPQIWDGEDYIGGYTDLIKHLGVKPE